MMSPIQAYMLTIMITLVIGFMVFCRIGDWISFQKKHKGDKW